jgi:hypothetical protein
VRYTQQKLANTNSDLRDHSRDYATDTERGSVLLVVVAAVSLKSSSRTSLGPRDAASCSGLPRLTHDLQGPHKGPEGALLGFEMGRPFLMPSSQFFGPCNFSSSNFSSNFSCKGGAGRNGAAGDLSRGVTGGSSVTATAAASGSSCSLSRLSAVESASSPESLSDWATGATPSIASTLSTVASSSSGTDGDATEGAPSTRGERAVALVARGGEPPPNMALSVRVRGFGLERPANTPSATALAWAAGESALLQEGVEAEGVEAEAEEAAAEEAEEVSGCATSASAFASACGLTVGGTSSSWAPLAVPPGVVSP